MSENNKILAIWGHPYIDFTPEHVNEQVEKIFAKFYEAGITYYMPFLAEDGQAYYQSRILKTKHDYLSVIIDKAGKFGIKVHPLFGFGRISAQAISQGHTYQADIPLGVDEQFPVGKAVCASWKQNQEILVKLISEILASYPIDGIQLDYFRYPNMSFEAKYPCECGACCERRMPWLGRGKLTQADLKNPAVMAKEISQKGSVITKTLQAIVAVTSATKRPLSLAARARYHDDAIYEGQDWHQWIADGYLDMVFPMSYNQCKDRFARFLSEHYHLTHQTKAKWISGIGKKSSLSNLCVEDFILQMQMALDKGVDGICIFSYKGMTDEDFAALKPLRKNFV